ncbi:hypothetical protein HN51_027522 [Arachis hypogaea]
MVVLETSRCAPSPVTTAIVAGCCRDTTPCLNANLRHLSSVLDPLLHSCCHRRINDYSNSKRFRLSQFLFAVGVLYLVFISCKFPQILKIVSTISGDEIFDGLDGVAIVGGSEGSELSKPFVSSVYRDSHHQRLEDSTNKDAPLRPNKVSLKEEEDGESAERVPQKYGRITGRIMRQMNRTNNLSVLERMTDEAWTLGLKAWEELDRADDVESGEKSIIEGKPESCPSWISMTGDELQKRDGLMFLPCKLAAGSSITMVGTPHFSHKEYVPKLRKLRKSDGLVAVSQFMVELQGLKSVEGEAHLTESSVKRRLKQMNSLEHNTCYRMH